MIDVSDGLVQDATHLAINSNLSLELNINQLPLPTLKSIQKKELLKKGLERTSLIFFHYNKHRYL